MDISQLTRLDKVMVELKAHPAELLSMVRSAQQQSDSMAEGLCHVSEDLYTYYKEKAMEYGRLAAQLQIYLDM